ncbi:MAG: hypothetical protein ACFE9S_17140 [Candidatus Hermodarchaeota archaeon]
MIQKREKVKCPVCGLKFIPESFHFEKTSFDQPESKGAEIEFPNGKRQLTLKPFTAFRGSFITYCPDCRYLIKFAAELGTKELVEDPSLIKKLGAIKEFGNIYKYQYEPLVKPYMDYSDYFLEKTDNIKKSIKEALDKVNFAQWSTSYNQWKENKTVDSFKFLIHFFSNLISYLDSQVEDSDNKTVAQKIEELNLSKNLEVLLNNVRELRNKISHEIYELSEEEEKLVENAFTQFIRYLILEQLTPLNLNKIKIEKDHSFIDIDKVNYEIIKFLHLYLGNLLHFTNFYHEFLIPLFTDLKINYSGYNPK